MDCIKTSIVINKFLVCKVCDISFKDCYDLCVHLLMVKHRACFVNDFDYFNDLFQHESILIRNCAFQCHVCCYYFNNSSEFLNHVKTRSHQLKLAQIKRNIICLPCKFECLCNDDLNVHLLKEHCLLPCSNHPLIITQKNHKKCCDYCKGKCQGLKESVKQNINQFTISNHLNLTQPQQKHNPNLCPFCKFESVNNVDWKIHLFSKHDNKCQEFLFEKNTLNLEQTNLHPLCKQREKEKSEEAYMINCLICYKVFDSKLFNLHIFQQHDKIKYSVKNNKGKRKFKCSTCSYLTPWKTTLHRHEKTHISEREKRFKCPDCSSCFYTKDHLKQHQKLHTDPTFPCDICHRQFHSNPELLRHKKIHSDIRPYLCDHCGFSAKKSQLLARHVRTHTKDQPFKCHKCSYTAATSSQLLRHKRLHSGLKPYKCPYCLYVCNTQENLRKHILKTKKHQNKMMYSCEFCTFSCNLFNEYRNHLLNKHKNNFPHGDKDICSPVIAVVENE